MKGLFFSISILTTLVITALIHPYELEMLLQYGFHLDGILLTLGIGAAVALLAQGSDKSTSGQLALLGGAVICLMDVPLSMAVGIFITGFLASSWLTSLCSQQLEKA